MTTTHIPPEPPERRFDHNDLFSGLGSDDQAFLLSLNASTRGLTADGPTVIVYRMTGAEIKALRGRIIAEMQRIKRTEQVLHEGMAAITNALRAVTEEGTTR